MGTITILVKKECWKQELDKNGNIKLDKNGKPILVLDKIEEIEEEVEEEKE